MFSQALCGFHQEKQRKNHQGGGFHQHGGPTARFCGSIARLMSGRSTISFSARRDADGLD
jgi:hypothetical protein